MSWISKLKIAVDNSDKIKEVVGEAVGKSKAALGENADKINSVIDTVTNTADSKTGGKYSDRIEKLKDTAKGGVSNLSSDGSAAGGTPAPGAPPAETVTPEPDLPDAEVVEG